MLPASTSPTVPTSITRCEQDGRQCGLRCWTVVDQAGHQDCFDYTISYQLNPQHMALAAACHEGALKRPQQQCTDPLCCDSCNHARRRLWTTSGGLWRTQRSCVQLCLTPRSVQQHSQQQRTGSSSAAAVAGTAAVAEGHRQLRWQLLHRSCTFHIQGSAARVVTVKAVAAVTHECSQHLLAADFMSCHPPRQ